MRFAVIGAGVSGLGATKILNDNGEDVIIFEKASKIGGIWSAAYPGASLQNSKYEYYFPEYPANYKNFHPTAEEVRDYLNEYVDHFDIRKSIRFNTEVTKLELTSDNKWAIKSRSSVTKIDNADEIFDYIIVAKGQFYDPPNMPQVVQQELKDRKFAGEIIHDRQYLSRDQLIGKKVVVVGYGKTALDVVSQASELSKSAHLVFREPRWLIPLKFIGLMSFVHIFFARHAQFFINSWHLTPIQRFARTYFGFVFFLFWRLIEALFNISNGISSSHPLASPNRIEKEMRSATAVAPANFFTAVKSGKIKTHQAEIQSFDKNAITLTNGETIEADLIITATGFKVDLSILPPQFQNLIDDDGIYLYRHMIHPEIPNLAFAGFNNGFMHLPLLQLGMCWLLASMKGIVRLPSKELQLKEIGRVKKWKNDNMLYERTRASCVGPRVFSYFEELCGDMGVSTLRKSNIVSEYLMPYSAADWNGIKEDVYKLLNKNK